MPNTCGDVWRERAQCRHLRMCGMGRPALPGPGVNFNSRALPPTPQATGCSWHRRRVLLAPAPGAGASERAGAYRTLSTAGVWFWLQGARMCVYTDGEAFAGRRRRVREEQAGFYALPVARGLTGRPGWDGEKDWVARRGEARRRPGCRRGEGVGEEETGLAASGGLGC